MATTYKMHRRINAPLEFRGLKGRYIFYAGAHVLGSLFVFAIIYCCGMDSWISLFLIMGLGTLGLLIIYRRSNKYGIHGWKRHRNARQMPTTLQSKSRTLFFFKL